MDGCIYALCAIEYATYIKIAHTCARTQLNRMGFFLRCVAFRLKRCDQTHTHSYIHHLFCTRRFRMHALSAAVIFIYLFCLGFYVNYIKCICCCYSKVRRDHIFTCWEQRTDTEVSESESKRSTHVMLFLNANRRRTKESVTACLDWIRNCENKANLRYNTTSHGLYYC